MKDSGKCSSAIPSGKGNPKGSKQTSGQTKHGRMTTGAKVENLNGFKK
jgi:hypothetical protein